MDQLVGGGSLALTVCVLSSLFIINENSGQC